MTTPSRGMTSAGTTPPNGSSSDRIVEAAIELFHQHSYEATSLRQVADAVQLQVGSLYNHISSKEELLFRIMRRVMVELIDHTREAMQQAGDDVVAQMRAFMQASIHFHATRREETFIGNSELRALSEERRKEIVALRDEYQDLLGDALAQAADEGLVHVDDVQLATFTGLAICSSVATWYRPGGRLTIADLEKYLPGFFTPLATVERGR